MNLFPTPYSILYILSFFISGYLYGQDKGKEQRGVMVENAQKDKAYLILEGYQVKVFTRDTNRYQGVLGIKDQNTIMVDDEEVKMSAIDEFRGNNRRKHVAGKITMLTGAGLIGAAVVAFIVNGEIEELTPLVKAMIISGSVGTVMTSVGAAIYADKRNYKSSKGWTFRVNGL